MGLRYVREDAVFEPPTHHKTVILRVCNFIGFEKKLMLKTKGLRGSKVGKNQ
jgi:hypothetical protein